MHTLKWTETHELIGEYDNAVSATVTNSTEQEPAHVQYFPQRPHLTDNKTLSHNTALLHCRDTDIWRYCSAFQANCTVTVAVIVANAT